MEKFTETLDSLGRLSYWLFVATMATGLAITKTVIPYYLFLALCAVFGLYLVGNIILLIWVLAQRFKLYEKLANQVGKIWSGIKNIALSINKGITSYVTRIYKKVKNNIIAFYAFILSYTERNEI